jgi:AraC-like DNA-binding protein
MLSPLSSKFLRSHSGNEFKGPVAELSCGDQFFEEDTHCSLLANTPFLGLFFNLENALDYSFPCNSLPEGALRKNQYMFMYVPEECCEYDLKKGRTFTLRIDFAMEFLKPFTSQFPVLEELVTRAECKIPYTFREEPLTITDNMQAEISGILRCQGPKEVLDALLYTRVFDLLLQCLEQITIIKRPKDTFNSDISNARTYILDHLQDNLSLNLLSNKISVDSRTLTRNFKKVYNITVMDFVFEERMKKAVGFLHDSNKSITQIAILVGYKSVSNFSEAFTRRFGYSPSALRKHNSKGIA